MHKSYPSTWLWSVADIITKRAHNMWLCPLTIYYSSREREIDKRCTREKRETYKREMRDVKREERDIQEREEKHTKEREERDVQRKKTDRHTCQEREKRSRSNDELRRKGNNHGKAPI